MQISLNRLAPGKEGNVVAIDTPKILAARLRDFGMIPGARVRCCYRSPQGSVTALEVMGTVIAMRTAYLKDIMVSCV